MVWISPRRACTEPVEVAGSVRSRTGRNDTSFLAGPPRNPYHSPNLIGISRKTFYKRKARDEKHGGIGLCERSRAPRCSLNATPANVIGKILYLPKKYHFRPERIAGYLLPYHQVSITASSVHRILCRHGLETSTSGTSAFGREHPGSMARWSGPIESTTKSSTSSWNTALFARASTGSTRSCESGKTTTTSIGHTARLMDKLTSNV